MTQRKLYSYPPIPEEGMHGDIDKFKDRFPDVSEDELRRSFWESSTAECNVDEYEIGMAEEWNKDHDILNATSKDTAERRIQEYVNRAYEMIENAQEIADTFGIEFSFDVAYGMGGTYTPMSSLDEDEQEFYLRDYDYLVEEGDTGFWRPSSQSC